MNLNFTSIITLGVLSTSSAWVSKPNNFSKTIFKSNQVNGKFREGTKITAEEQSSSESSSDHLPSDAPCWQDFYDDDCGMSAIYASNFVAKDWIKSMPCAKGLEDCDMPEDLKVPGHGVESTDVMGLLGLKRADDLKP